MKQDNPVSLAIQQLRLPLAVMVVFIHSFGGGDSDISHLSWATLTSYDAYNVVRNVVTALCGVAVPLFFAISGYLFFQHLDRWDWGVWRGKMHRRIYTLLIPFLVWNILRYAFNAGMTWHDIALQGGGWAELSVWLHDNTTPWMFWHNAYIDTGGVNWLGTHLSMSVPVHVAFWFIRDLMVMCLCTPIIYYVLRRMGGWALLVLAVPYVSGLFPTWPLVTIGAVFYFTFGAWLSLGKIGEKTLQLRHNQLFTFTPPILVFALKWGFGGNPVVRYCISPLFVPSLCVAAYSLALWSVSRTKFRFPAWLADSTFIIFAFHVFVLIVKDAVLRDLGITIPDNGYLLTVLYFLWPALAVVVSVTLYWFTKRYAPKMAQTALGVK